MQVLQSDNIVKYSNIVIQGGTVLNGEINLSGAKNAALPMIVAACLGYENTILENVPIGLRDVQILIDILRGAGANITVEGDSVSCSRGTFPSGNIDESASKIRYSLLLLGLAAALKGELCLPMPGGCKIGDRKYDLHLMGLQKLGVIVKETDLGIEVYTKELIGEKIEFYLPTTSGTENLMIAAVTAEGETTVLNANTRPEIIQLAELLNAMGAKVECNSRVVRIQGVSEIRGGARISVMPGWDEAVTYMVAAGISQGEVCIPNFNLNFVKEDVRHLREIGVEVFEWRNAVYISGKKVKKPFDLFTAPYPGVNSDMQPIFASLALGIEGASTITDLRFTDRFQYVEQLKLFGADIESYGNVAIVRGGKKLRGAKVTATDLRGGMSCILAGLIADGETHISNIEQIERGYENIVLKLQELGSKINYV